ncbi:MAG: acyl carrier protein [Enhygromyxa sp.]
MELRQQIWECVTSVAPEAELDTLDSGADLREELDLDSMDFLRVLIAVKEATGVEVPERDYPRVRSLDALVEYVAATRRSG